MFLYLNTGGGHLAPAKAVAEKIRTKQKADTEIELVDGLSDSNNLIKKIIEDKQSSKDIRISLSVT
jgi:UDP-N-acetylglucosamine:LPS N-acetylglucosamine transferase